MILRGAAPQRRQWLIIIIILILILTLAQASSTSGVGKFRISQEMKFEKPIKDVVLGTMVKDKDTIIYPKIITFDDEICCFNEKGKMLWNHKETSATFMEFSSYLSTNGKFILTSVNYLLPGVGESEPIRTYFRYTKIFNDSGNQIWNKIDTMSSDGSEKFAVVSDNGYFAILDVGYAMLEFYDSLTNKINSVRMLEGWNWKRTPGACFSDNGENVAAFFTEPPTPDTSNANDAIFGLFDKTGKMLWSRQARRICNIAISLNGEYILIIGERFSKKLKRDQGSVSLFDRQGRMVKDYEVPRFFGVGALLKFSSNGQYAIIGCGMDSGYMLINTANKGKILWKRLIYARILSGTIFNNGMTAITTLSEQGSNLELWDKDGKLIKQSTFSEPLILKQKKDKLIGIMKDKILEFE